MCCAYDLPVTRTRTYTRATVKRYRAIGAALLACSLVPLAGHAADEWGGALNLTSDYVFRGITQTRGDAAVQADLHWHHDGKWIVGLWGSTADPNPGPGATVELNGYAGRIWGVGRDWLAKLIAVHYAYPEDTPVLRYDYDEVVASLAFRETLIATVAWSPNSSGFGGGRIVKDRQAMTYELAAHLPWRDAWVASAGVGYYDLSELFGTGYTFWSCGVTYSVAPWQLTLARIGTSQQATELYGEELTKDRWSLGVQWRFRGAVR